MGDSRVNLIELLIPSPRYFRLAPAESAESAENQQRRGLRSPHLDAETCGKGGEPGEIRTNPHAHAEAETHVPLGFPHNPHNPHSPYAEIEKPLPMTREFFRAQGLHMLAEDLAFLRWHLPKPTTARHAAVREYVAIWLRAAEAEPLPHRKDNRGRFAANTWLRAGQGGGR